MSHKRPLTYEELVELAENLSDIEYLSDDNDEFTGDTPVEQGKLWYFLLFCKFYVTFDTL